MVTEDEIHITIQVDDPDLVMVSISEIEYDAGSTGEFSRNYFYYERES